eukprot:TRINITY_DN2407_c0_g1_i2.p1 TRINITY_DN2407_c0_g1~~TRINITY_DN2407_c0_g1_i2.p1  ORF type:complete len:334 (+),score=12.75 TRINITY_DN2407_c0_g1_i2:70-1071(+)
MSIIGEHFKILMTSDNHLGYKEDDNILGEDTFTAFEEILKKAIEKKVDIVLCAGDLFHRNIPSRNTLIKTCQIIKKYCFGGPVLRFETVSMSSEFNYMDPSLGVSLPIFCIHGNHDDPSGFGMHSALDLLNAVGLINYFGRLPSDGCVSPVLFRKGQSKIALYGVGCIRDERLFHMLSAKTISFSRPNNKSGNWFNILVCHQNRKQHSIESQKMHIKPEMFPPFIHFILWGHEHGSLPVEEVMINSKPCTLSQVGAPTVMFYLQEETIPKKVQVLTINKAHHSAVDFELKNVRKLFYEEITLPNSDLKEKPQESVLLSYITGTVFFYISFFII